MINLNSSANNSLPWKVYKVCVNNVAFKYLKNSNYFVAGCDANNLYPISIFDLTFFFLFIVLFLIFMLT